MKKMPVAYLVILVRALPLPAPKRASVAVPPKACPTPASFLGNCTRTSKIRNSESSTSTTVKKPIIQSIIIFVLNGVLHNISKTPGLQRGAPDQSPIHIRQAHQLPRIGGLH